MIPLFFAIVWLLLAIYMGFVEDDEMQAAIYLACAQPWIAVSIVLSELRNRP